jgi:glycosyltransferase involved in cell wall biosynthesis
MNVLPFVSVVIPSRNRAELLSSCLRSLTALDYPRGAYELIVVDDASTDETQDRVRVIAATPDGPKLTYIRRDSPDPNAARNAGIDSAHGELLAFIDDDVIVPPGWLSALVGGAARWPGAHCFGGPVRPIFQVPAPATCPLHELAGTVFDEGPQEKLVGEVWGGNMALRPEAIALAGPFRAGLRVHQDWEWQQRLTAAGGQIVYLVDAWLWHVRPRRDMRLTVMVGEFMLRGYVRASHDEGIEARHAALRARQWAEHTIRTRCARGATETARSLGLLCGVIRRRLARRDSAGF